MKRFIEKKLVEWKASAFRKPLLVRGARQVGKTRSITDFGNSFFKRFVKVDLEKQPIIHRYFAQDINPAQICRDLEVVLDTKITPGETLLFIDEIQACPRAITALRYFYEELPELHVIAAGSLLEFALQEISFPVGRIQILEMFPMGFIEFLQATGNENSANILLEGPHAVGEPIHHKLLALLRIYLFTGGMPAAVDAFRGTGAIQDAATINLEIVTTYRLDFAKYAGRADRQCLDEVLVSAAKNVGKQIKYSSLSDHFSFNTVKKAYFLIELARVVHSVPSCNPQGFPLGTSATMKTFKTIMVDMGLMHQLCGLAISSEYAQRDLLDTYRGALAEQYIGQELLLSGQQGPYYWKRDVRGSNAEVDYLCNLESKIFPIEVKSGAPQHLKSIELFLRTYPDSPYGIVLSQRQYEVDSVRKIRHVPLYYAYAVFGGKA
jgi:predicted AAA+ superfamily ATPase